MTLFVHLTPHRSVRALLRGGIRPRHGALYAMPVIENYLATHQWTRELMKWRRQPVSAIYFRIGDAEIVYAGVFNKPHRAMTAAQAHAALRAAPEPMGFECIVERAIAPSEIVRVAPVRGVVGWRHFPKAHGIKPCPCCIARGEPGMAKMRRAYKNETAAYGLSHP